MLEYLDSQQNMKFILESVNSQGLPSYEDVAGEDETRKASCTNTSKLKSQIGYIEGSGGSIWVEGFPMDTEVPGWIPGEG